MAILAFQKPNIKLESTARGEQAEGPQNSQDAEKAKEKQAPRANNGSMKANHQHKGINPWRVHQPLN